VFASSCAEYGLVSIQWEEGTFERYTLREVTMEARQPKTPEAAAQKEALVREMLERVGDKWTLLVIEELGSGGELRFTRLRDRIGNVSQKMLTKTLRELERDGLVTRRVHPVVPPRVDYKLTKLGEALGEAVCGIWTWVEKHMRDVERSRQAYDRKKASRPAAPLDEA
jgi:DNA-binding HxlR family transcriptional regulator